MISTLSGFVVLGAGIGSVWYCRPHNGQVQWFVVAPILDWLIPTFIVAAIGLGIGLIVAGVMS